MHRVGIYPGTFDPIHIGHLSFATAALADCGLDRVVFLPESMPRGKVNVTRVEQRLLQINRAIVNHKSLTAQLLESPQFSVIETLPEIQSLYKDSDLTLLIGSDVALSLSTWEHIDTLLAVCTIAIGMRSNQNEQDIQAIIERINQRINSEASFTIIHTDHASAASSALRDFNAQPKNSK